MIDLIKPTRVIRSLLLLFIGALIQLTRATRKDEIGYSLQAFQDLNSPCCYDLLVIEWVKFYTCWVSSNRVLLGHPWKPGLTVQGPCFGKRTHNLKVLSHSSRERSETRFESEPRYLKAPGRVPFSFQAPLYRIRTKDLAVTPCRTGYGAV